MTLTKGDIALSVVCVLAGILLGAGFRDCSRKEHPPVEVPVYIHDTLTVHDTLRIKEHTKPLYVTRYDTLFVEMPASPLCKDNSSCNGHVTVPVEVSITQYEYRDTFTTDSSRIELGVCFSGYKAKIDDIDLQYRFDVQPRTTVKKNGWGQFVGIGIGVGAGVSMVGQRLYAAPEIELHITYGWGYHW